MDNRFRLCNSSGRINFSPDRACLTFNIVFKLQGRKWIDLRVPKDGLPQYCVVCGTLWKRSANLRQFTVSPFQLSFFEQSLKQSLTVESQTKNETIRTLAVMPDTTVLSWFIMKSDHKPGAHNRIYNSDSCQLVKLMLPSFLPLSVIWPSLFLLLNTSLLLTAAQ